MTFTPAEVGVLIEWLGSRAPTEPVPDLADAVAADLAAADTGARDIAWGVYREGLVVKLARLAPSQQRLCSQLAAVLAHPAIDQALADRDEAVIAAVAQAVGIALREVRALAPEPPG